MNDGHDYRDNNGSLHCVNCGGYESAVADVHCNVIQRDYPEFKLCIPADLATACQEPQDAKREADVQAWLNFMRDQQHYGFPKSSGIPETARAILDMVPERKTPQITEKQQQIGENIARAVKNLSHFEARLGASRYQP
jgi:hypothetical protein